MGVAAFIAGDWGTTNLRLSLCDAAGVVLDSVDGPGVSRIAGDSRISFADLTAHGQKRHSGALPAVLCGMVGSTIGWINVPYVACPFAPERIADAMTALNHTRCTLPPDCPVGTATTHQMSCAAKRRSYLARSACNRT